MLLEKRTQCTVAWGRMNEEGKCLLLRQIVNSNLAHISINLNFPDCQSFCGFSQLEIASNLNLYEMAYSLLPIEICLFCHLCLIAKAGLRHHDTIHQFCWLILPRFSG